MGAVPASAQVDARMVPPAGGVGRQDRVRLRRRHLARAEEPAAPPLASARRRAKNRSRASRPTARKLAYSADYDGNTDVYVVSDRRRRAGAAHASPDGRPRRRLAS